MDMVRVTGSMATGFPQMPQIFADDKNTRSSPGIAGQQHGWDEMDSYHLLHQ